VLPLQNINRPAALAAFLLLALAGCQRANQTGTEPNSLVSTNTATHPKHTNRLAREKSPYLRQHMHNPVDWYPWGEEAFARARAENKPIFLSIGYSTCHWCHVMERESFEDETVAAYLKEHFISIKIDREERPDVDKIYMTYVQASTGGGGWPLNVFLTPDLKPFFGGTYFAPDDRHGRPGFLKLLRQIVNIWETRRADIVSSADDIARNLASAMAHETPTNTLLAPALITNAAAQFKAEFDPHHGGFGGAPKFPRPSQPAFLLRYGAKHKDQQAINMVLSTCQRMAAGGIHDQLGGGFARYSVDAKWLVPHFEKMLYDNAQLAPLYLDAHLVSGDPAHAEVARGIFSYVLRDMTHPEGGFYSAEDADSEGHEGKFYCWTREELSKLLTPEEFTVAVKYFGVTEEGNFVDHSHPQPLAKQNVLSVVEPELSSQEAAHLTSARRKLFEARTRRIRPHLDDKVLASWNGLMLGAFARGYAVLGEEAYRSAAEKNVAFLQARLWDAKSKTLYHRWRDGERDSVQLLDAYAFLLGGVLDLYEATLEARHLEFALALAEGMLAKFYDPQEGGFWQSTATPDLILRVKEDYDGAEPSGNSVAALALLKLAAITDRKEFRDAAEKTLRLFADRLQRLPQAVPQLLQALDFFLEEPRRVVIAGDLKDVRTRNLLRAAHAVYQPHKVVLHNTGPVEPFAKALPVKEGPVVYLCTGTACQPPTSQAEKVKQMLQ
jgi:uncharacterized protein YyaL (SSP411 family)